MLDLLKRLWPLKRSLVSDEYDKAIEIIKAEFPLEVDSYESGTRCWDWIVPDKWTCHDAYLLAMNGERLIDYRDNPLHCVEYSNSIDTVVTRSELFTHLHVHPKNPTAIPYIFKFYERDWGLCCSQKTKETLRDPEYRVVIKTDFEPGHLRAGQWWLPGDSDQVFVLVAHLCHPFLANDDLSGVVVGLEVMRQLAEMPRRYYTFLLLLIPETIGSIAWLSHNEDLIPKIKGGLFLEMLGNKSPHALQRSYFGRTQLDLCCEHVIVKMDGESYIRDFWKIVRNDELEFNSPGVRIPMPSLSRCLPPESEFAPYPEYHTHLDTPDIISEERLIESATLVLKIVETFDQNICPKARFKGQPFLSRYDLFPRNLSDYNTLFQTLWEMDGEHSIIDIAMKHSLDFDHVLEVVNKFRAHNLVSIIRR
jgi:aminopeptidase-like protein